MENKRNSFFWTSYVDVLTVLFVVTLVLFVLVFKMYKDQHSNNGQLGIRVEKLEDSLHKEQVFEDQAKRIRKFDEEITKLLNSGLFIYDSTHKRYLVKAFQGEEIFTHGSAVIKDEYKEAAVDAGSAIWQLVDKLKNDSTMSFIVLVEGNTALKNDNTIKGTIEGNYELSFKRSLALVNLWKDNYIEFNDERTELIIAGSGIYGVGRHPDENLNKRFLIQVIPKLRKSTLP